eukprot:COSAG01_NODE_2950_length_6804_cov_89.553318_4_plen_108_part_00
MLPGECVHNVMGMGGERACDEQAAAAAHQQRSKLRDAYAAARMPSSRSRRFDKRPHFNMPIGNFLQLYGKADASFTGFTDTQHILEPNVESVVQVEGAPTEAAWVHA